MNVFRTFVFSATLLTVSYCHAESGEMLYADYCAACPNFGVVGAPKVGDREAWAPRLAKGSDTLVEHALNGFEGESGSMPPKGGFTDLSDEEVRLIVEYMMSRAQ